MKSLITLQDEYIARVNAAHAKWAHTRYGGHIHRTLRAAHRALFDALQSAGYSDKQTLQAIRDAREMAQLIRDYGE